MKTGAEATGSQETGDANAGGQDAGQGDGGSLMATAEDAAALLAQLDGENGQGTAEGDGAGDGDGATDGQHDGDAATEGDGAAEGEDKAKPKGKVEFTPEQQAILDSRIGHEVAKRKGLEERLDKIQRELDRQRRDRDTSGGQTPPVFEMDEAELDGLEANTAKMLNFLKGKWDGTVDPEHPEKGGFTKEQVRTAYETYQDLRVQISEARRVLEERKQVDAAVSERYPDLAPGGPKDEMFQKFRKMMGPAFAKLPQGRLLFAHMLLGESVERVRAQQAQGATKPKPGADEPPKLPLGSRGARRAGAALDGAGTAKQKSLNLQRLVDSGGSASVAVELLAEAGL